MASVAGRKNNVWRIDPVTLTMKVVLALLKEQGEDIVKVFWELFPGAQEFFPHTLTKSMILSRAGWDVPTKYNENPNTNGSMRHYVAAGREILIWRKAGRPPLTNEELRKFCYSYKPIAGSPVKRREIKSLVREEHLKILLELGGRCPCCRRVQLINGTGKFEGEFDHFYSNQAPDFKHTWPICKVCHSKVTHNQTARDEYVDAFRLYQKHALS